ncbi:PREDICTED: immunoglobulin superfamily member 3-like isoform X1 [Poecilia mexicana]|uniref:Ig-like domain-containing protein n=1 Tax=Poecilia mexicana TaxID=48701 RepID=A0A3B3WL42_9TELE|nr:PREDICTED: immunoglobulin superfamily member 3-like isoform X1 [Poecilia mexicana]
MKFSVFSPWRPFLLISLGLFLLCEAQVNTEIQAGPLYRVVGSLLSISCNASGFSNPNSKKDFEIRMTDPAKPFQEINVMSTSDSHFSYARFSSRIQKNEISIKHVDSNSIIFEIQYLQKEDDGEYECTVVNPEYTYNGVYSAKTVVKVIDNSLSVTSSEPPTSLSYDEGEALSLTCQASTNTIQHVHLAFAWYLHKEGAQDAKPIISLDRDFTLAPGEGFERRYRDGAIRLDKLDEATYKLNIAELEQSDQGQIYCQAQEWIQDPDRSWYKISQKDAEKIPLTVKAKVVTSMSAVQVSISAQNAVQEGQELLLSCGINAQNLAKRFFSVAWLWNGIEVAKIGPTGILTVRQEYIDRERNGELKATRTLNNNYQLRIKPVKTTDKGSYSCRAWPEEREDGNFNQGAAQDSQPMDINIYTPESGLSVKMENVTQPPAPGEKLKLICEADGVKGQLSVTWKRKASLSTSSLFATIISLNENGVTDKAGAFTSREVRVTRPTTNKFVFELADVTELDSGTYECTVSETQPNGKTQSQTTNVNVNVKSIESAVKMALRNREPTVTVGNDVQLMCKVSGPRVPMTLTWSKETEDSNLNTIVVLYSNGSISWSGDQYRYQVQVDNQGNTIMHNLKILRASHREAGKYQCMVSVFQHNVYKKLSPSNLVNVQVHNPASKLAISSNHIIVQRINTDIQIDCKVTSRTSEISLYAVTWELQQDAGNRTILTSDLNGIITFGKQIKESDMKRISMKHTDGPTFELTIQQVRILDKGIYMCKVEEYQQDPWGEWYLLSKKNSTTNVNVIEPEKKLSVGKEEAEMNISIAEDFSIPCHITQQSSNESQFQVTWFRQQGTEDKTIFTVYRNSTLKASDKNAVVRYDHPSPRQFDLTVLKSNAEDSGMYFCEVEEWIHAPGDGWQKHAVEKSGNLNVTVAAEGHAKATTDLTWQATTWIPIYAITVLICLCIITILSCKLCRKKTPGEKKSGHPLWTEQVPLDINS